MQNFTGLDFVSERLECWNCNLKTASFVLGSPEINWFACDQPVPGSQIVQWERIKTSKAKIRRARLEKGGGGGGKNWTAPARFRISFF